MSYHYYQSKPGSNPHMQNTPKKNNSPDQKPGDKEKKRRQKTTAVALSILLVLTTMVVGYGMISNNEGKAPDNIASSSTNDSLISYEETSRKQADKIRSLKKQLFATNQKLYEHKSNLFTKGDPKEKARIAELSYDLMEKANANNAYAARIQELEQELELNNQKINALETSILTLHEGSQVHKDNHHQSNQDYQVRINELEEQLNKEKLHTRELHIALNNTIASSEQYKINVSHTQNLDLYDLQEELKVATENLRLEMLYNHELHVALNNAIAMYENEQSRSSSKHKQNSGAPIVFLQERLADLDKELARKNAQIAQLSHELSSGNTSAIADETEKTKKYKEEIQKNIKEMSVLLKALSNKEEEVLSLHNINNEQKRQINELTKSIAERGPISSH
jgi:hypothetical protein